MKYQALALLLLLHACGERKVEPSQNTPGIAGPQKLFLMPSDFVAPSGTVPIAVGDIASAVNDDAVFFLKDPPASSSTGTDDCAVQLSETLKVRSTKTELVMEGTGEAKDCFPDSKDTLTKTVSAQLRIQFYIACKDRDLSSFNGIGYSQFSDLSLTCMDGMTTYAFQYALKQVTTAPDVKLEVDLVFRAAQFTPEGKPCTIMKLPNGSAINNCILAKTSIATNVTASGSKASTLGNPRNLFPSSFSYHTFKNTEFASRDDRFYRSGSIDFKLNNWSGTMTYSGTGSPKWTASDGTNKANGDFSGPIN